MKYYLLYTHLNAINGEESDFPAMQVAYISHGSGTQGACENKKHDKRVILGTIKKLSKL